MNISNTTAIYFSPTGTTEKVVRGIGDHLIQGVQYVDITRVKKTKHKMVFHEQDLLLIGVPVYGGRVPAPAMARLRHLQGTHTPAVIVAVYGNRAWEDALLELKAMLVPMGFHVIGAAAFIGEHSIMPEIAKGRPDEQDMEQTAEFAGALQEKLDHLNDVKEGILSSIPGNYPYREYKGVPLKPKAGRKCNNCGLCASKCPVGAISISNGRVMKEERCISCMRCIAVCPQGARKLGGLKYQIAKKNMMKKCKERKIPEFFL